MQKSTNKCKPFLFCSKNLTHQDVAQTRWTIPHANTAPARQKIISGNSFVWNPVPRTIASKFDTALKIEMYFAYLITSLLILLINKIFLGHQSAIRVDALSRAINQSIVPLQNKVLLSISHCFKILWYWLKTYSKKGLGPPNYTPAPILPSCCFFCYLSSRCDPTMQNKARVRFSWF